MNWRGLFCRRCWTVSLLLLTAMDSMVWAESSRTTVTFDTSYWVACCEITTPESDTLPPSEKLIEAKFEISSLIRGRSDELLELLYRIESPGLEMSVVDYLPRTQLETEYAGNVSVELGNSSSRSLGVNIAGKYEPALSGDASASRGTKDTENYHYELLAPLELVTASGTLQRGTGAYFKLKSSPRMALEGSRSFVIVMRVPQVWRAGCVRIVCEGLGDGEAASTSLGQSNFPVALYLEGDEEACQVATNLVLAERRLQNMAVAKRHAISRRSYPAFPFRIVRAFSVTDPKVPADWLDQVMSGSSPGPPNDFLEHLPAEVLAAAQKYRQAKADLWQMRR